MNITPNIPGVGSSGMSGGKSKPTQSAALSFELTDLHQPRSAVTQSASGHLVDTLGPCTACDWDWPCPTVKALNTAIGDHTP